MKTKTLLLTTAILLTNLVWAQVIHVPGDQPTIQDGINASNHGDTVLVAEGTYLENIRFNGKAIMLASEYILDSDSNHIVNTIIDGSNLAGADTASTVLFIDGEDTTSILNGFSITGGTGTLYMTWQVTAGGGIYAYNSGGKIINNIINGNHVEDVNIAGGAGICFIQETGNHWVIIKENYVGYNTSIAGGFSSFGGGMAVTTNSIIENNIIEYNSCTNTGGNTDGGGIEIEAMAGNTVVATVRDNIIRFNVINGTDEAMGGGIRSWNVTTELTGNLIESNECHGTNVASGGGYFLVQTENSIISENIIRNNLVKAAETLGGGIYGWQNSNLIIDDNLLSDNQSQGQNSWGGAYASIGSDDLIFSNNKVDNNTMTCSAYWFGSGIWINTPQDKITITKNEFDSNWGTPVYNWSSGGAIGIIKEDIDSATIITQNIMKNHNPERGGALWTGNVYNLEFTNNLVVDNHATDYGGGIRMEDLNLKSGGIYFAKGTNHGISNQVVRETTEHAAIINNTFVYNSAAEGGTIDVSQTDETPVIFNNIFWGNEAENSKDIKSSMFKELLIAYNDIDETGLVHPWTGNGNIFCNPAFFGDSVHLHWDSQCLSAGTELIEFDGQVYYSPEVDIEDDQRPVPGNYPDIGADESDYYVEIREENARKNVYIINNYPNPFSKSTTINYELGTNSFIQLAIYNQFGNQVTKIIESHKGQGKHQLFWNAENLQPGLYYCIMKTDSGIISKKLIKID